MTKHNAENERIKRQYFAYLKEAKRSSEQTVDAVAMAIDRFEKYTKHKSFKVFHVEQAIAFKRDLAEQTGQRSGEKLSKSTMHSTMTHLKNFFFWLAGQTGYKARLKYSDADYFNISEKDVRIATAHREQRSPTLEQVKHVIANMPAGDEIEQRNRALIAFAILTGARDAAIASMKLKHVDLIEGCVHQDAREVKTKFSKTFVTYFAPVGDEVRQIFDEWVRYLREQKLWGNDDPLFPATRVELSEEIKFAAAGLDRKHWSNATPIRKIFQDAFDAAGLPYFHPHSFRQTLTRLGEQLCQTPEEFKAFSQNLGHEHVLTTFISYGKVETARQGDIMRSLGKAKSGPESNMQALAEAFCETLRQKGVKLPTE